MSEIKCPKCGSSQWRCWDERNEWFEITEDEIPERIGELIELPVGYLACTDCGYAYTHHDWQGVKHLGNDGDVWGHDYY